MRIEAGRARRLRVVLDDDEGYAADTSGEVHIEVTRPDGTVVLASTLADSLGKGAYEATLPAQTQLDDLTMTATVTGSLARTVTERITVVGQRLVTLERLRQDPELEEKRVPVLTRILEAVEQKFTTALSFPPVPTPARVAVRVKSSVVLPLGKDIVKPIDLYSVVQASNIVDVTQLRPLPFGELEWIDRRLWTLDDVVSVWLSHGFFWTADGTPPEDLRTAGATYARYLARTNRTPERAIRVSTDGSDIFLGGANADRPTGLPDVDAVLNGYALTPVV